ncbi:MAG: LysR family transcriptional regulator [Spirochaetes bacterium]|nr:LysR family transcriptional regulator [Spirochaetota bacterium]MBU1080281.1 LysR family transcriptional regulator [Spirochaetota bacterium]
MTLRHLEVFIAALDEGGVSAAARALSVAQPAVSQTLRELEREYDIVLFERLGRRLSPTSAARSLAEYARRLLALRGDLERGMRAERESPTLRIGASATVGAYRLPEIVARLREARPEIRITARVDNTRAVERLLLNDGLDAGIVEGPILSPGLVSEFIETDELVVIAPPGHALAEKGSIAPADLAGLDFIVREPGSGTRTLFEAAMKAAGIPWEAAWVCSGSDAILGAVAAGLGLAAVPRRAARLAGGAGSPDAGWAVLETPFLDLRREFRLVTHADKIQGAALRALREACSADRFPLSPSSATIRP